MNVISGQSIQAGVAFGPLHIHHTRREPGRSGPFLGAREELARFEQARQRALQRLEQLYHRALIRVGKEEAEIFHLHRLMLEDEDYLSEVDRVVREQSLPAPEAALAAGETFAETMEVLQDPYLKERADDVREIARMVSDILRGEGESILLDHPVILVADDLAPGQLIDLGQEHLLGLILHNTSPQGHVAILARAMGVPTVTQIESDPSWEGRRAALDGARGLLYLEPDSTVRAALMGDDRRAGEEARRLHGMVDLPSQTLDGREISICANIGSPEDAEQAVRLGAQGVGLFRTELLFLRGEHSPSEEEQFHLYRKVAQIMEGRRVVIRTLDIGADKCPSWFPLPREENPALGRRGIRISMSHPDLFTTQLRAILRAAVYGRLAVMFPMVSSVEEVRWAKGQIEQCRDQLQREQIPFGPLETGVMVETPAAAVLAGELAGEADFFSIGTNDLTQYTLAMDRQEAGMSGQYVPCHPAVLELIRHTVEQGHCMGRQVSLCGQLAADLTATETLLRLGLDELSVPPTAVLPLRDKVRSLDLKK